MSDQIERDLRFVKTVCVIQHVEAEYLGLLEDHLEGRNIRFRYCRPFTPGGKVPTSAGGYDALVILGAGCLGVVSGDLIPSLGAELRLARNFIDNQLPVVGIGAGAAILSVACGGGAAGASLRFALKTARRVVPSALDGHLPTAFPVCVYMRDRIVLPGDAQILAVDSDGEPVVFQLGGNSLGFLGHPGVKTAMIEDLIMNTDEVPADSAETLARLRSLQPEIAAALGEITVGLMGVTHLMDPSS